MSDQYIVICGKCGVKPEVISDADGETAVCPGCGQRDNLEKAQRIAAEHFLQESIPGFQKGLGKAFSGKFTKFKAKPVPKRTFRWHAKEV